MGHSFSVTSQLLDNTFSFNGSTHFPIVAPASVQDLGDLIRHASVKGEAIYPVGGRTMIDLGGIPTKTGTVVDLRQWKQVIDYPARDMTITVQAGITIAELRKILNAERQHLPIDVPFPEQATLGGAIAANASGARRFGLGTLRDYVIGISVVNDEGVEIKGGGRVVKNVAGYDLMKLYTGSLGTLGIISQVTLKLKPLSEATAWLALPASLNEAPAVLETLHATRTRPIAIDYLDGGVVPPDGCFYIGFEDNAKAVAWQIEQLRKELPEPVNGRLRELTGDLLEKTLGTLRDFALRPDACLTFKANVVPSAMVDFCKQAIAFLPTPLLQAHAGNGIVIGHFTQLTLDQARTFLEKFGALASSVHGNLIVTRCPADWKSTLSLWGRPSPDRILMKAVKEKLDPKNVFNPGRFVDGI